MKTPEEMAKEYVEQEQLEYDEAGGAYYGFLAGYKAAQDRLLARFKSLLSSFAETSFNPNHTAWQMFDILNDQVADASKVTTKTAEGGGVMVERVREVKITVYVDTNKDTYEAVFDDVEEARDYLEGLCSDLFPDWSQGDK